MRRFIGFIKTTVIGGLIVILPIWIIVILLIKAVKTAAMVVAPVAAHLPQGIRFTNLIALLLVLAGCFFGGLLIGLLMRTSISQHAKQVLEQRFLERIPGYTLLRSLSLRIAAKEEGQTFAVALAVIEDALVPAFIVEEHEDGRYTVFVIGTHPSGWCGIYPPERTSASS